MVIHSHPVQLENYLQSIVHEPDGWKALTRVLANNGFSVARKQGENGAGGGLVDRISEVQRSDGQATQLNLFKTIDIDIIKVYHSHPDALDDIKEAYRNGLSVAGGVKALAAKIGIGSNALQHSLREFEISHSEEQHVGERQSPVYRTKQGNLSSIDVLRIYHRRKNALHFVARAYMDTLAAQNGNISRFAATYGLDRPRVYREMRNLEITRN